MDTFTAISDPNRRLILESLANRGQLSVSQICDNFAASISQPAVSQHLKVLKESNLVVAQKVAQKRFYSINPAGFDELEAWALYMKSQWNKRFNQLDAYLNQIQEIPAAHSEKNTQNNGKKTKGN